MLELNVTKNFDLSKIRMDFSKELNEAAERIRASIFKGVERGISPDGMPFKELKEKTIKAKMRKGYSKPASPLIASDKMRKLNIEKATKANQEVRVFPGEKRRYRGSKVTQSEVGTFHEKGEGNLPQRKWFFSKRESGIAKRIEDKILRSMELRIERELRRA